MTDTRNIDTTGPAYPPPPGAGSNAIGKFEIGVSPIGDIPRFNYWDTVMSQYANAPAITSIIGSFASATDLTALLDQWFDDVWNIQTCKDWGLDVWGRIVGVNRVLRVSTVRYFGFAEALPSSKTWNTGVSLYNGQWVQSDAGQGGGPFYDGLTATANYRLETESYRRLIMAKAAFNITDCSIPSINQLLLRLFPNRGNCYVAEGKQATFFGFAEANAKTFGEGVFYSGQTFERMVITYTFDFPLTPVEYAIVHQSGVLPKPTGVKAKILIK